jgi:hypothetical protein
VVTVGIPEHAGQRSGHGGQHSADPPNRPSSARTGVRHAAGMVSAITPESCPSWAGVRTFAFRDRNGSAYPATESVSTFTVV